MDIDHQEFGALLRRHRVAARLTQEELGQRAEVSARTIRDLERGAVRAPRRHSTEALADALALSSAARSAFTEAAGEARWAHHNAVREQLEDPAATPRQLPPDASFFVGRTRELALLDTYRSDTTGRPAVIAIVGAPGVGKTALAVHWANRVASQFPDGQLYINLRGYDSERMMRPAEALAGLLRSLGVANQRIPAANDEAGTLLRSVLADKRMLIFVDNARTVDQVRPLLPSSPGCLVVTTSRHSLGGLVARDGARRVVLDVLPPDDAVALLTATVSDARTTTERHAVANLARACSFLPLALRIAAANLTTRQHQPIGDYVAVVTRGDSVAGFAVEGDDSSKVRTVFDQSYETLTEAEQRVFRLASLIPGPDFTADAVATFSEQTAADAVRLLHGLSAAHMVNEGAFGRYSFHDLTKVYARERASEVGDDVSASLGKLFGWYLSTTVAAAELLYPERTRLPMDPDQTGPAPFGNRRAASAWLGAERRNLIAAVHHAAEHGPAPISWQLLAALRGYFWANTPWVEWLDCANAALAAALARGAADGEAAARLSIAQLLLHQGRHKESLGAYRAALGAMRRAQWREGEVATLSYLGNVYMHAGVMSEARELQSEALALSREFGLRDLEAYVLHALARLALLEDDFDAALDQFERAKAIFVGVEDRYGEANSFVDLAGVHCESGRHADAMLAIQRATELSAVLGSPALSVRCSITLANIHRAHGSGPDAVAQFQDALDRAQEIGSKVHEAEATVGLAGALVDCGEVDEARQYAESGLSLCRRAGYRLFEGDAMFVLARVHLATGDRGAAAAYWHRAVDLFVETGYRLSESRARRLKIDRE